MELTHLDKDGKALMVDVGQKDVTRRTATAAATLRMKKETLKTLLAGNLKKGDALAVARVAGIMAAKRTSELIPLCHNIPIESVTGDFENDGETRLLRRRAYAATRPASKWRP